MAVENAQEDLENNQAVPLKMENVVEIKYGIQWLRSR